MDGYGGSPYGADGKKGNNGARLLFLELGEVHAEDLGRDSWESGESTADCGVGGAGARDFAGTGKTILTRGAHRAEAQARSCELVMACGIHWLIHGTGRSATQA
jgi:hypothetical protein